MAMNSLGCGLMDVEQFAEALPVQEAELSTLQRLGGPPVHILTAQSNIASTYLRLGKPEQALPLRRLVYSRHLELYGKEHPDTVREAANLAQFLSDILRFEESKTFYREILPVARRVLGEDDQSTIMMRVNYAHTLLKDLDATLDELREAVTTLEETERTARRVLGGAHPWLGWIEKLLGVVRSRQHEKRVKAARGGA